MKIRHAVWDAPVFDGEWCFDYGTTTYWSPFEMIDNSPYNQNGPLFEDAYDFYHQNNFSRF